MNARSRTTWMIIGLVGIAAIAGGLVMNSSRRGKVDPAPGANAAVAPSSKSALATLAEGLSRSEITSLAELIKRLEAKPESGPSGLSEEEGAAWVEVVKAVRVGYLKFPRSGARAAAVGTMAPIFAKFGVEPAPEAWLGAMIPSCDLLNSALNDPEPEVRAAALATIGKLWAWFPGRAMTRAEEHQLDEWKDRFHEPAQRKLADRDPRVRSAAIACLGLAPIDALAAPAVAYVDDAQSGMVRHQVLVSFAGRPSLLTEDMILKRLHDGQTGIPQLAEVILKARGLTRDQIALGRLISSPRAEMRASVIPLLKDHDDLDPSVWLLRLSHDADETVRAKAVEAMTGKDSPDLLARLREMARDDSSAAVRAAAGRLVTGPGNAGTTAALPPLPGSPRLTPRAN